MGDHRFLPEDELNRFWNDLVADERPSAAPPDSLDPAAAETMRWLARLGAMPTPAASRERVRRGVREQLRLHAQADAMVRDQAPAPMPPLHARRPLPTVRPSPHGSHEASLARSAASSRNGRVRHAESGWFPHPLAPRRTASMPPLLAHTRAVTGLVAALVLAVAVAAAVAILLHAFRLDEVMERASVAGPDSTASETALTGEATLLELTLADMPAYRAQLGMFIATLLPGTRAELRAGSGPQLFFVAEGPITVRARTAPEPLEAIPPKRDDDHSPAALIPPGDQATMETGSALLVPAGAVIDLFTTGSTAGRVVDLLSATDSQRRGEGVPLQFASNGGMTVDLVAPVSISLRQGSLAPEATLPAPASDATRQVVATLQAAAMGDLRSGMDGSVRNAGEQTVDLYVLTVTAGDAAADAESE